MATVNVFQNTRALMVRNLRPGLTECGKIKIGQKGREITSQNQKKFQPPQKLDHFLITTLDRGADGNFTRDHVLHAKFGDKPTEIPVRLLFNDPWLNFQTVYTAFKGAVRFCTGDGETAQRVENGRTVERDCPCGLLDPTYAGNDKCKINGTLSVMIDGAAVVGGVWKLRTTSINTCQGIASSLALLVSVTGGRIAGVPLMLTVRPKAATTPQGQQTTVYVVGLEYRGTMEQLRDLSYKEALADATHAQRIEHVEEQARRLLAAPIVNDDEDEDVRDEFYPEAAAEARGIAMTVVQPDSGRAAERRATMDSLETVEVTDVYGAVGNIMPGEVEAWARSQLDGAAPEQVAELAENNPGIEMFQARAHGAGTPEPKPARTIPLYDESGTVAGNYPNATDWLARLEIDAQRFPGLINTNWEMLTRIATSSKTPADVRERAERLRETAERDAQQREHEDAA